MDHQAFENKLRANYRADPGSGPSPVRLPSPKGLMVSGTPCQATLTVAKAAVCSNMQSSSGAVDGWALVLMRWCGVQRITLDWEDQGELSGSRERHYQRFLYRVTRFAEILGDMVEVAAPERLERLKIGKEGICATLNMGAGSDTADQPSMPGSEAELEKLFAREGSPARAKLMRELELAQLERQFPVGVFAGDPPTRDSAIFTGGKSAIDLVGVGKDGALHLFELKTQSNVAVGAISELFFYCMVMRDVRRGLIAFSNGGASSRLKTHAAVRAAPRIEAHLLAPRIHPLLDDPSLKPLNEGAARLGWDLAFSLNAGDYLQAGPAAA